MIYIALFVGCFLFVGFYPLIIDVLYEELPRFIKKVTNKIRK